MKTKITVFAVTIILCFTTPVFAGSIGSKVKPVNNIDFAIAVEDNIIFGRYIESSGTVSSGEFDTTNQIYGKLIMAVPDFANLGIDYANFYAKIGASDCSLHYNLNGGTKVEVESEYGFLWGIGGIGVYEFTPNWHVGLDTQFNWWQCDVDKVKRDGDKATNISGEIRNWEFQATLFVNTKYEIQEVTIKPYVGGVISYLDTHSKEDVRYTSSGSAYTLNWDLKGDDILGIVIGSDILFTKNFVATVEARFIYETALTTGLTYKF